MGTNSYLDYIDNARKLAHARELYILGERSPLLLAEIDALEYVCDRWINKTLGADYGSADKDT